MNIHEQNRKVTYESLLEGLPKKVEYKGDVYTLSLEIQQDSDEYFGDEHFFCLFYSCGGKFLMIPDNADIDLNCAKNNVLKWLNENKEEVKTFER